MVDITKAQELLEQFARDAWSKFPAENNLSVKKIHARVDSYIERLQNERLQNQPITISMVITKVKDPVSNPESMEWSRSKERPILNKNSGRYDFSGIEEDPSVYSSKHATESHPDYIYARRVTSGDQIQDSPKGWMVNHLMGEHGRRVTSIFATTCYYMRKKDHARQP